MWTRNHAEIQGTIVLGEIDRLLIWGAGGHGKVVLDCAIATHTSGDIAFIDDAYRRIGPEFCGHRVLGGITALHGAVRSGHSKVVVAIGDNRTRAACFDVAQLECPDAATIVHPAAVVSRSATIGAGTVVMPGAVINAGAEVGRNCIVNTCAVIEHDCVIGDHVHISPRAALGGGVTVGRFSHVGIGATVLPGASIGDGAVVGAGAVVLRFVAPEETVVGVPAHTLVHSELRR
jgi:acetyltransferase EpsM